jgi:hypothetical protein
MFLKLLLLLSSRLFIYALFKNPASGSDCI